MKLLPRRSAFRAGLALGTSLLLLAGCGADSGELRNGAASPEATGAGETPSNAPGATVETPGSEDGPLVVATTSILGDVVANVMGGEGQLEVLMPAGADPHGFQPSASHAALLRDADLVVAIGLDLEENLLDVIDAAAAEGVPVLAMAEHLDPIAYQDDHADGGDHADEDDHADEHDHGPLDPHVWFDPVRMATGTGLIADELDAVADGDWQARAEAYADEVLAVHAELEQQFGTLPVEAHKLVTNHDSLGYLAHRYDFEVLGTVVPGTSTQAEADARAFAELVETIMDAGVGAIFTENIESAELADQLAREVAGRGGPEVRVVSLYTDALGEPGSGAETYLLLLRENADRITDGLG